MAVVDDVRHDAASLYRFINSILTTCDRPERGEAYLPSSGAFLKYVRDLAESTKLFLEDFPGSVPSDVFFNVHRQKLWTLRTSWFELHQYVKPAADAHTLSLPAPLIRGLAARFQQLPGFNATRFTIFQIDRLNYLQVVASRIRDIAKQIADIVPHGPHFPDDLCLIGIPYSQASTVFLNCLIPHEMGHFAYGEKSIGDGLLPRILSVLSQAFAGASEQPSAEEQAWLVNLLVVWAEEMFCDLFAIRLIGPCYCYAFIELFDLGNLLDASGNLAGSADGALFEFSVTHPAFPFRLKHHAALLSTLGWWPELESLKSHYYGVLNLSRTLPDSVFKFPVGKRLQEGALRALFDLMPNVVDAASSAVGELSPGVQEYKTFNAGVRECLKSGVVPSAAHLQGATGNGYPSPVTVLNSAYAFYLESLDELILGIQDGDPTQISHRQRWTEKLEMWTLKAIEDYELLGGRRGK